MVIFHCYVLVHQRVRTMMISVYFSEVLMLDTRWDAVDSIAISSPFVSTGVFRRCSSFEHAYFIIFQHSGAWTFSSSQIHHPWYGQWPSDGTLLRHGHCHGHGHGWPRDLRRHQHGSWSDRCRHRSWTRPTRCPSRRLEDLRTLEHVVLWCSEVYCGSMWVHYPFHYPFQYPFRFDDLGWSRWVHSNIHSDSRIS